MPWKIIYSLLLFITFSFQLKAEDAQEVYTQEVIQQNNFDKNKWAATIEGIDYSGDREKEKKKKETEENTRQGEGGDGSRTYPTPDQNLTFGSDTALLILKIFSIVLGVVLLAFILKSLLGMASMPKNKKIKDRITESIDIKKIEENIHESDLDRFIREALAQKEYGLAIRLYYLAGLKELSTQKAIKWKKDKTNRTYLNEMRQNPLFDSFRNITRIFERVRYGNAQLEEQDYQQIEPAFKQFIHHINRKSV